MNLFIIKVGQQYVSHYNTADRLLAKPFPKKNIAESMATKLSSSTVKAVVEEYWSSDKDSNLTSFL